MIMDVTFYGVAFSGLMAVVRLILILLALTLILALVILILQVVSMVYSIKAAHKAEPLLRRRR